MSDVRRVLIIGAGLAGPCLARSLALKGIRSTIFEIRPAPSDSGGSLSLGPNALLVLDRYANVYDRIRASGFAYHRFGAYTDEGERLGDIAVGEGSKGYPAVRIMRPTLHKILLEAAGEMENLVEIKYGTKMNRIEENDDGVTVHFEDGSMAKGDVLIGADGIHSKVREHVLEADAPTPLYTNGIVVNGFLPLSSVVLPSPEFTFPAFMFTPSGMFMAIPIDPEGKTLAWGINTPAQDRSREDWLAFERSGAAARLAKSEYADITVEPVRSLLDSVNEADAKLWAPFYIPDIPTWHTGRSCLIGDAAHGLPPNGQGSGLAFEDAAILTRLLVAKTGDVTFQELFERFEAIRRPRLQRIRSRTKDAGTAFKSKTNGIVWAFKKLAFRAFFWWNGGVLDHTQETSYDVDVIEL
ncbi:hypothetical protein HKX48_009437 [Thoreauomyces humboldtii]|nr:hypothetical protein HKX48_009437 [Thoreauomyces humboldtii]